MWCRETRQVAFDWMIIAVLAICMAAVSVRAQEPPPIEVQSVDLRTGETAGTVVIRTEKPVEWSVETGRQTLVLFLPHSVPGPDALDRSSRAGLISLVEVGFALPGGVPTARITVHSRKPFEHEVARSEAGISIRLAAIAAIAASAATGDGPGSSEAQVETSVAPRPDNTSAGSGELEEVVEENDRLRRRVAELHSDRLELRESLDSARRNLADRGPGDAVIARTAELEDENRRLVEELSFQKARLAESGRDSTRLSAQVGELTTRLGAAEDQTETMDLTRENQRLSVELEAQKARLTESGTDSARLSAQVEELTTRLGAAQDQTETMDLTRENQRLSVELEAQKARLAESRQDSTRLSAQVAELTTRLGAAEDQTETMDLTRENQRLSVELDAQKVRLAENDQSLARFRARVDQLEGELAESRSATVSLRSWLSRAPRILSASDFVVSPGGQCLPLRPEPRSDSAVLRCLPAGSALEALNFRPDWLRVRTEEGKEGWVSVARVAPPEPEPDNVAQAALTESRAEVAGLEGRLGGLEGELEAERTRRRALELESQDAAELASRVGREQAARVAAQGQLDATRSRVTELEQAVARLGEVEAGSGQKSKALDAARLDLGKAQAESEAARRKLRALLAEVNLRQLTVSLKADPCLSVRAGPTTDRSRLDCLEPGTAVSVVDATAGWLSISTPGGVSGWVASKFVQPLHAVETSERTVELERSQRAVEQQLGDLRARLEQMNAESESKTTQIAELDRQLRAALNQSEEQAVRATELGKELEHARAAVTGASAAAAAERNQLESQIAAAKQLDSETSSRLELAGTKRQELEEALAALKSQLELERTEALGAMKVSQVAVKGDVDPCLNLRQDPAPGSRSLDCLPPGTEAQTVALAGGWFRLRLQDGREGWSSGEFLQSSDQMELRRLKTELTDLDDELEREKLAHRRAQVGLVERDDTIARLEGRIAVGEDLDRERERLNGELVESRQEVASLMARLAEAEDLRTADQTAAEQARADLERQTEAARAEITRLGPLAGRAGEVPILESALQQARESLAVSEARNESLVAQVSELGATQSKLTAATTESDRRAQQIAGLESDLASMRESFEASAARNESLAAQVLELEATRSSLTAATTESDRRAQQIAGLESDLESAQRSLSEQEVRNRALQADASALVDTRESLAAARAHNDELSRRLALLEDAAAEPVSMAEVGQPLPDAIEKQTESGEPLAPRPPVEVDMPGLVPADLQAFAQAWAKAWSAQRVDDYLSCYAATYVPPFGMNRAEWSAVRRNRLIRPKSIEVELSNYRTRIDGPDRAMVSFDQEYRSDTFQDRVVKTLELIREGDLWKILGETAE